FRTFGGVGGVVKPAYPIFLSLKKFFQIGKVTRFSSEKNWILSIIREKCCCYSQPCLISIFQDRIPDINKI
ncbi:MAG: hypothetical protein ACI4VX_06630, partial [Succinivibrionaceae bacterium]